ncbi:hypothetical protein [Kribbella sp. NPDC004536]|uniref:hypothetical protein n=1 Tax=Kribbella sp. NPDC004536 TaxID=3364106 RepID=UPI0036AB5947
MRRLILLLAATLFLLTSPAWAAGDPRVDDAVAAWARGPLYVDPDFVSIADSNEMVRVIAAVKVPVFVAVVPTGEWFPEKGDTELLAGRLAAANGKPGVYVVMDGDRTYGVANQVAAYAPDWTYPDGEESLSRQLREYLDGVGPTKYGTPEPPRTTPTPAPESSSSGDDRFTAGKAIGNGLGGTAVGMIGGGVLGGIVLIVAAVATPRRRKERS